jgi:hypothetical protein
MGEESLGRAVLELTASIAPLQKKLEEGKAEAEAMSKSTAGGFKAGITKAAIPAAIAVGGVALALHKSIEAAEDDQAVQARLGAAYKSAGLDMGKYKGSIEEAVQSSAKLGFRSNDVQEALGTLIVATHNHAKAVEYMSTAEDIARFKHISLTAAAKIMTSASAGSARAARQLGIAVSISRDHSVAAAIAYKHQTDAIKAQYPVASKQTEAQKRQLAAELDAAKIKYQHIRAEAALQDKMKTSGDVVDMVSKKLHGQADAYANTAAGAKEKMGAELQLLEENIGRTFIPILTQVTTTLASVTEEMSKHKTIAEILLAVIGGLGAAVLLYNTYLKLQPVLTAAATAAQWLFNAALDANPIAIVILALVAIGVALFIFRDKLDTVWKFVVSAWSGIEHAFTSALHTITGALQSAYNWIKDNWPLLLGILTGPFGLAVVEVVTHLHQIRDKLEDGFDYIKTKAEHIGSGIFNGIVNGVTGIAGKVWDIVNNIAGLADTYAGKLLSWGKAIGGGIVDGITSMFKGIKDALVATIKGAINGVISLIDAIELPVGFKIHKWHGIPDGFSITWGHPIHIPLLAEGGIVNSPTLAMIGEKGPEAVVPLGKGAGMGITVNVSGVVGNEREVAARIGRELQKLNNTGLGFGF